MDPLYRVPRVNLEVFQKSISCVFLKGDINIMYPDWPLADLLAAN